ncbi:hypothetical protein ABT255_43845 [Streptomyces mirabilis]|uniref:hypothetical protein n=1 Tax=Streptomyces mirabilis TaxID=68239 RepID=UPI00332C7A43
MPDIAAAAAQLLDTTALDGELVVWEATAVERLQNRLRHWGAAATQAHVVCGITRARKRRLHGRRPAAGGPFSPVREFAGQIVGLDERVQHRSPGHRAGKALSKVRAGPHRLRQVAQH